MQHIMESDFQKMIDKAVEIREKYSKTDPKQWDVEQVFMGMIKDIGNLSKLIMIQGGYRHDINVDINRKLKHELADLLYSVLVLSAYLNIDLEKSFWDGMRDIEKKLKNK